MLAPPRLPKLSRCRAVVVACLFVHVFVFAFSAQLFPRRCAAHSGAGALMVVANAPRTHSVTSRSSAVGFVGAARRHDGTSSGPGPLPFATPVHVGTWLPSRDCVGELPLRVFDEPARSRVPAVTVARGPPRGGGALASAL